MTQLIKPKDAQDIYEDLTQLQKLWNDIKFFLMKSFTEEAIGPDLEHNFLEAKSQTTKYLRVLAEKVDAHQFRYDPEKITNLLRQAISVTHLRGLPVQDRKNLVIDWHVVHVHISQVLGAFHLIVQGYQPKKREKKDTSIAAMKKGASGSSKDKDGGNAKTVVTIIILLAAIGGAVLYLMSR